MSVLIGIQIHEGFLTNAFLISFAEKYWELWKWTDVIAACLTTLFSSRCHGWFSLLFMVSVFILIALQLIAKRINEVSSHIQYTGDGFNLFLEHLIPEPSLPSSWVVFTSIYWFVSNNWTSNQGLILLSKGPFTLCVFFWVRLRFWIKLLEIAVAVWAVSFSQSLPIPPCECSLKETKCFK